jgi:hypothetical protein
MDRVTGAGMAKSKGVGMQGLTVETVKQLTCRLRQSNTTIGKLFSIFLVTQQWIANMSHVNAYLVGSAGLQSAFDQGNQSFSV